MNSFQFIEICQIMNIGNYMNINLGTQGLGQSPSPMIIGEASPYLSPLCGSLSIADQNSPDELLDFHLEEQPFDTIRASIQLQEQQFNPELFLAVKETDSEAREPHHEPILELQPQKIQVQTPASVVKPNRSKVYSIIQFLVQNDGQADNQLILVGRPLYENQNNLEFVFKTLLGKFKKLRKTKQEMVKYCMRKAFKFSNDQSKPPKPPKTRKQKTLSPEQTLIEMPFRKNSSQKTMNIHFLKQIFSNRSFVQSYTKFLQTIRLIIEEDNDSKIAYLSDTIERMLASNQVREIQGIKRLPWTRGILGRTEELARSLLEYASVQGTEGEDLGEGEREEE